MIELTLKYNNWHGKTDRKWKILLIDKCKKDGFSIDQSKDLDWIYDDCIDYITLNSPRKLLNLFYKSSYTKMPCHHCLMILRYWHYNDDVKWSPDSAHLFPQE